jgi:S-adenosylmethionine synthetase
MILKTYNKFTKLDDLDFEVVERKGRCHPDTLADRLAELLSVTYSKFTKEKYGVVLRHQFDKLS